MDDNTPTHFNVLIAGTGLVESILAAALSKSGYSVLQLDSAPYYGTQHASLSLTELHDWALANPAIAEPSTRAPPPSLIAVSQRFALSLAPLVLRARGRALDLLVRSKVSTYLQFGLLGGVGLCTTSAPSARVEVERVPASKADVFNDPTLSLIEKRRLTKLLLFAAGEDAFADDKVLAEHPEISFLDYLKQSFNLSGKIADSLAFALALCSSPSDLALPALERIRSIIRSIGRYGPSPYLVGHYGGAGDLVGGFSRICAVWGGGQILGRPLLPLALSPPAGTPVPASQPPFMVHDHPPPPPAAPDVADSTDTTRPLGIPVQLDEKEGGGRGEPTIFTGDWVVGSPHLLSTLFPNASTSSSGQAREPLRTSATDSDSRSIHLVAILSTPIPFPRPRVAPANGAEQTEEDESPAGSSDSNLFVFPPRALHEAVGTVTAFQVGKGTMACPEGYHVLYLSAPILAGEPTGSHRPSTYLTPYLDSLLSLCPASPPPMPLYTVSHVLSSPTASAMPDLPPNFLLTPELPSTNETRGLVTTLDEIVPVVQEMFWKIVGEEGRSEGVEFFKKDDSLDDDEDD
ncbi:hypothetical protein JCM10212_002043 [Sporobolomyces blumeae]